VRIGYFLSSEEYDPHQLVEQARLAEEAGTSGVLAAALPARRAAHIDMLRAIATD
jgi:hypothetical protein